MPASSNNNFNDWNKFRTEDRFFENTVKFVAPVFFCVLIQLGLEWVFGALTTVFLSIALSSLVASFLQGGITGALSIAFFDVRDDTKIKPLNARQWLTYMLGGGLATVSLAVTIGFAIGGPGGGPPRDFFDAVTFFACMLLVAVIIFPIIFLLINVGLRVLGVNVASEFAEEEGENVSERYVVRLFGDGWSDKIGRVKDGHDLLMRSLVSGLISGSAIFYLEGLTNSGEDFISKVFIELFGALAASIVWGLIMAVVSVIFKVFKDYNVAEFFTFVKTLIKIVFALGVLFWIIHLFDHP
jgi:hypothetical protein